MSRAIRFVVALGILLVLGYVAISQLGATQLTLILRFLIGLGAISTLSLLSLALSPERLKGILAPITYFVTGVFLIISPFGLLLSILLAVSSVIRPDWLVPEEKLLLTVATAVALLLPAIVSAVLVRVKIASANPSITRVTIWYKKLSLLQTDREQISRAVESGALKVR